MPKTKFNGKLLIVFLYVTIGWTSGRLISLYNKFNRIQLFCFSLLYFYILNYSYDWLVLCFVKWIELKVNKRQHLAFHIHVCVLSLSKRCVLFYLIMVFLCCLCCCCWLRCCCCRLPRRCCHVCLPFYFRLSIAPLCCWVEASFNIKINLLTLTWYCCDLCFKIKVFTT